VPWAWRGARPMRAIARAGAGSTLSLIQPSIWLEAISRQARGLPVTMHTGRKQGAG